MAVNYTIRADIIDITTDQPKEDDIFLVDTNVWYWMTYTRASQSTRPPAQYQTTHYPNYTAEALNTGSRIYQTGLSLAELTHLIEKAEREIYCQTNAQIKTKEYRHNHPNERSQVIAEVTSSWSQVVSMANPLTATIDEQTVNDAHQRFQIENVDGYDLFILESMKKHNIIQVITDDGDFSTVPDIKMFTANRNVLNAARLQNRLIAR